MLLDYETLKIIWWCFMAVLLIGFALTDGFDLGMGMLLPFVARSDEERRVAINAVGPTWDGNQVWLITAGGALFAAWPLVYAASFSGFYVAMLLVLFALFFRPVGFEYRNKLEDPRWRTFWDWGLFAGGFVPALVFGVAFGNLLQGVPFHFDPDMRSYYEGSFFALLNPFGLLAGVVSVALLAMHGAIYLQLRTGGAVYERCRIAATWAALLYLVAFALAGLWVSFGIEGYRVTGMPDPGTSFGPLAKSVTRASGAWLDIYRTHPWAMAAPAAGFLGALLTILFSRFDRPGAAFLTSAAAVTGTLLTAGLSMFPFVMPSSSHPSHSLTLWDAVSSHRTLELMFFATVLFLPLIVLYTSWVYRVMWGRIDTQVVQENRHNLY
ncbi:MAG: cytochrome d ubiquinol oxidase subunit II [Gammaproteobacteria bacterium]|nr:MAG: cytochrome d ubiquinol oxidase subunit II [Gammaproteobacteria bacterium]